jgi:hypothetical protein
MRLCVSPRLIFAASIGLAFALPRTASSQANYEIQVYGAATVDSGHTMVELHSNYTLHGFTMTDDGTIPDNHAIHETVEITHGFSSWTEIGFYIFTSDNPGYGEQWVGDHIRPRFRVPESWNWPVGFSISQEVGYVRPQYSADTWSYEFRPIIDKQIGKLYIAVNPAFEHSLRGPDSDKGFQFAPGVNVGYDVTEQVNLALEYYGSVGSPTAILPDTLQQHQLFYVANLNLSPDYEINFGYGVGLDRAVEKGIIKLILGRRF